MAESSASAEEQSSSGGEIIVFAAASMTDTLTEIKETYEAANPGGHYHLQFRLFRHAEDPDRRGRRL